MHAAAVRLELRIPGCRSLKEKRRVLRPIVEHLRRRMELSVSEVGHQDSWQRAAVAVAVVAPQAGRLEEVIEGVRRWLLELAEAELVEFEITYLELP
ncbi:MAG: DUF503 domain-containing protein [Acidimicrobiia bacterium]